MALSLRKLTQLLANIKNEDVAKNKFLKSKPKIQEMKQNMEKSQKEAAAIHSYVTDGTVFQSNPAAVLPPLEADSFKPLIETLQSILNVDPVNGVPTLTTTQRVAAVASLEDSLQIGTITSNGTTYLTTKARAEQLTGVFSPMSAIRAQAMNSGGGKII